MPSRGTATVTKIEDAVARDPWDFPPNTKSISYQGVEYVFRELTVAETDTAREASTDGEKFDGRLMTRLMIVTGSVEPKMTLETLGKMPQRLYSAVVDLVNVLNDPDALAEEEDKEKNA